MPYLFCLVHGPAREAGTIVMQDELRAEGECVLVIEGSLCTGPWRCDSCNAQLAIGDRAWLKAAFPRHVYDDLVEYDFSYERDYFALTPGDRVASYGMEWPDDSLQPGRIAERIAEENRLAELDQRHE